jgi:hypothetical protein
MPEEESLELIKETPAVKLPSRRLNIRLVTIILSILFILAVIPLAIYLVKQRQEIRKEARPSGTVIENDKFKATVIDVGPGNYASNTCPLPGANTDASSLTDDSLTQIFTIENKTTTNYKLTLISYPYKIYALYYPDGDGCLNVYTEEEINAFVSQNGGDSNEAYRQFARQLLTSIKHVTNECAAHVYDNELILPHDPSVGRARILTSPGGLSCSQLGGLVPRNTYSDAQTHIGSNYLSADSVTIGAYETVTNQSFTFYQSVCGFYQWDQGFLVENLDNPGKTPWVMWAGSELKFFPCFAAAPTPTPTGTPKVTPTLSSTPTPTSQPTTTPTTTPTPTPTLPPCEGECLEITVFNENWSEIDPSTITIGQTVYFAVKGEVNEYCSQRISKARFRINQDSWQETTVKDPSKEYYYIAYTISESGAYTVEAMIYCSDIGWR